MPKSLIGKLVNLARPIPFNAQWNLYGGQLYGTGPSDRFTQVQAMGTQGTLFAIVQLLSSGGASTTNWKMYRKNQDARVRYTTSDKGSDQRREVLRHAALELWNRPNEYMTGAEFREIGWQHMELVGEWYWVLNRGPSGKGIPIEMWPVRPDRMEPVPDRDNFLVGWVYTGPNGEEVPLTKDEVIQLKYPNPADIYRGLSAVQAILAHIDSSKYTAEWSRNFFLNSATPGGIVQFSKRLSDDEFNEFTARWREQHQGVARGHRVGVLEQGAVWVPNTYSLRDMQFTELQKVSSDLIRQAYRIHQAMLGDSTDVNRANAVTAEEVHIRWHEVSRLVRQRTVLNHKLLPMFGGTGVAVEFDFDDPNPASAEEANLELQVKSIAAKALVDAGYDPAEVLEVVGLPDMGWVGPPAPKGLPAPAPRPSLGSPEPPPALPPGTGKQPKLLPPENEPVENWVDIGKLIQGAFAEIDGQSVNGHNGHKERV